MNFYSFFFFQAEDGIRDWSVTGVQTCALPILTYKELEQQGVYLAVSEVNVRYRAAARYDDLVRVRCWVRELASRRVTFGYAVERAGTDQLLATGETSLISLTHQHTLTRIPQHVLDLLEPIPDPVRL